jgi:ABC-2 type transport system ATP-binding protein
VRLLGGSPRDAAVRARVGYLAENPSFHDHLRAAPLLEFHAKLQGIPGRIRRDVVGRTLRRVGLAGHERTRLRKFTTGMRRRIGLARAIQHDPELVILDEPMADLDPAGRREVRDVILSLREAGCTVLFSGRVAEDAEALCDRVAFVEHGTVRSVGPLDRLGDGAEWFEITLDSEAPATLPAELICRSGRRCLLRVEERHALRALLLEAQRRGDEVLSVWPGRRSLEERSRGAAAGANAGSEDA